MRSTIQRALFELKFRAGRSRALFWLLTRVPRGTRERTVDRRTELTIEGFPRSGNSFAEHAFRLAQPGPVRIAQHHHKTAHIRRSIRLGIPTLVLIREPAEAVASLLIFSPWMSPRQALRWYVDFHRDLEVLAGGAVLADFEEVIGDLGAPVRRLNRRYGTSFHEFRHSAENERSVFDRLDEQNRELGNSDLRVARPTVARAERKVAVAESLRQPALASLMSSAQEIYARLTALRESSEPTA